MSRTATGERLGGAAAWSPSVMPPIGVDLDNRQQLACAFRVLAGVGFSENLAGHITWASRRASRPVGQPVGHVVERDPGLRHLPRRPPTAEVLERPVGRHPGRSTSTPSCTAAVPTHGSSCTTTRTGRHRARAASASCPSIIHQNSCMFDGEMVFVDEYGGEIDAADLGARARGAHRRRVGRAAGEPRCDRHRRDHARSGLPQVREPRPHVRDHLRHRC